MPVKKSSKKSPSSSKVIRHPVEIAMEPSAPPAHRSSWVIFVFFLLFISIAIVSYAVYVVFVQQERVVDVVQSISDEVAVQQQIQLLGEQEASVRYLESGVAGLNLAYKPCRPRFTGACDDLMIYRLTEDGSKEVIIPSIRAFAEAPKTSELLQPIFASADGRYLVLGAWAFGAERNENDTRVWVFDAASGMIVAQSSSVPPGSVFSPDMRYAAYDQDADEEQVVVVNLKTEESLVAFKASEDITYKDPEGKVHMTWLANDKIAVIEYAVSDDPGMPQTIVGEKELTIINF